MPKETPTRDVDLAQLFLIYPFNVVSDAQKSDIIKNVEHYLLKDNGVCRYTGDAYYNNNGDAEWVFGLAYLGIIYYKMGERERARYFYEKIINSAMDYNIPELYYSKTDKHNHNTPLGWSISMTIQLANFLRQ